MYPKDSATLKMFLSDEEEYYRKRWSTIAPASLKRLCALYAVKRKRFNLTSLEDQKSEEEAGGVLEHLNPLEYQPVTPLSLGDRYVLALSWPVIHRQIIDWVTEENVSLALFMWRFVSLCRCYSPALHRLLRRELQATIVDRFELGDDVVLSITALDAGERLLKDHLLKELFAAPGGYSDVIQSAFKSITPTSVRRNQRTMLNKQRVLWKAAGVPQSAQTKLRKLYMSQSTLLDLSDCALGRTPGVRGWDKLEIPAETPYPLALRGIGEVLAIILGTWMGVRRFKDPIMGCKSAPGLCARHGVFHYPLNVGAKVSPVYPPVIGIHLPKLAEYMSYTGSSFFRTALSKFNPIPKGLTVNYKFNAENLRSVFLDKHDSRRGEEHNIAVECALNAWYGGDTRRSEEVDKEVLFMDPEELRKYFAKCRRLETGREKAEPSIEHVDKATTLYMDIEVPPMGDTAGKKFTLMRYKKGARYYAPPYKVDRGLYNARELAAKKMVAASRGTSEEIGMLEAYKKIAKLKIPEYPDGCIYSALHSKVFFTLEFLLHNCPVFMTDEYRKSATYLRMHYDSLPTRKLLRVMRCEDREGRSKALRQAKADGEDVSLVGVRYTAEQCGSITEMFKPGMDKSTKHKLMKICDGRDWRSISLKAAAIREELIADGEYDINNLPHRQYNAKLNKRLKELAATRKTKHAPS